METTEKTNKLRTTEKTNSIGQRVRGVRLTQSIKGVQLARAVGISSGHLSEIESGRSVPSAQLLNQIAAALDVSADYLLGNTDVPRREPPPPPWLTSEELIDYYASLETPTREAAAATDNGLSIQVPLLDEELLARGDFDISLDDIISYSRKFYEYSREELGGTYDKKRPPFAVRITNANLAGNGIPSDCVLIVNPALRPRPGEVCVVYRDGSLRAYRVQRNVNGEILLSTDSEYSKEPEGKITVYGPVVEFRGRPKLLPREDSASSAGAKQPESAPGISLPQPSEPDAQGDEL